MVEAADAGCASSPDLRISNLASRPSCRAAIAAKIVSTFMYGAGDGQSCCPEPVWFVGQGAPQGSPSVSLSVCLRSVSWRRGSKDSRKSVILR